MVLDVALSDARLWTAWSSTTGHQIALPRERVQRELYGVRRRTTSGLAVLCGTGPPIRARQSASTSSCKSTLTGSTIPAAIPTCWRRLTMVLSSSSVRDSQASATTRAPVRGYGPCVLAWMIGRIAGELTDRCDQRTSGSATCRGAVRRRASWAEYLGDTIEARHRCPLRYPHLSSAGAYARTPRWGTLAPSPAGRGVPRAGLRCAGARDDASRTREEYPV